MPRTVSCQKGNRLSSTQLHPPQKRWENLPKYMGGTVVGKQLKYLVATKSSGKQDSPCPQVYDTLVGVQGAARGAPDNDDTTISVAVSVNQILSK